MVLNLEMMKLEFQVLKLDDELVFYLMDKKLVERLEGKQLGEVLGETLGI